jgi:hypothetical protein
MLGVNKPIRMAIIPPETCASSSSVSSRVFSVSLVLLMIFSIQAARTIQSLVQLHSLNTLAVGVNLFTIYAHA